MGTRECGRQRPALHCAYTVSTSHSTHGDFADVSVTPPDIHAPGPADDGGARGPRARPRPETRIW
ncbi:hypothetical protein ACFFX0_22475 [Citricoccus parietis]|uniref:Uncharacterized protein n=1 Tax=Citricoccus parietis TaxID=592307 RepID=A0ABV5G4F5_9MICC